MKFTFHESYGHLPVSTLRLIKKFNVSPADFDLMLDILNAGTSSGVFVVNEAWAEVNEHIVSNSDTGMYRPRFF